MQFSALSKACQQQLSTSIPFLFDALVQTDTQSNLCLQTISSSYTMVSFSIHSRQRHHCSQHHPHHHYQYHRCHHLRLGKAEEWWEWGVWYGTRRVTIIIRQVCRTAPLCSTLLDQTCLRSSAKSAALQLPCYTEPLCMIRLWCNEF